MRCVHDMAAEGLADALVSQAHPENRDSAREALDQRDRHPGLVGRARPGRDNYILGLELGDPVQRDLVIAVHRHLLPQLAQVLHQVVGEGVVVVDHQQHLSNPV
jgi:hypothetical protein